MPIVRLIHVNVDLSQVKKAEQLWKNDCAPLMIRQKGCRSEQLLKCLDAQGEYISYSEWETQADIERHRASADHKTLQSHSRGLRGARAVVNCYEIVG